MKFYVYFLFSYGASQQRHCVRIGLTHAYLSHVKMTLVNAKSVNRQTLENVVRNAASEFTRRTAIVLSGPVSRDTARLSQRYPLLRAMGFLVSQHGQLGAIPPPPSLSVSQLESMRSGGAIPPPQKGYLSDTCAIPYETRKKRAIPPSAILSRKGIARYGGCISHWAAKRLRHLPL